MSTEISTIEDAIYGALPEATKVSVIGNALDAEKNYAIQQLYKNQMSADTARKNPVSVQNAIINLAAIGVSLNPALKHAYLVPRDGAICLDLSYMGLMHLAQETGAIEWGQAKIVYANDQYENQGLTKEPLHKYNSFGDRGEKVGVYCTVKLPNGDFMTEEMSAEQVNQVRATSKAAGSKYSPWQTFEEEMWRKTVVKRASKYWPKSGTRLDKAIHVINEHEGLDDEMEKQRSEAVKKLHEYTSDKHTPIELYGFLESFRGKDEDFYLWLYRQFPDGSKVSGKEKHRKGGAMLREYVEIFTGDDESAIDEAKEELTDLEIQIIERAIK